MRSSVFLKSLYSGCSTESKNYVTCKRSLDVDRTPTTYPLIISSPAFTHGLHCHLRTNEVAFRVIIFVCPFRCSHGTDLSVSAVACMRGSDCAEPTMKGQRTKGPNDFVLVQHPSPWSAVILRFPEATLWDWHDDLSVVKLDFAGLIMAD